MIYSLPRPIKYVHRNKWKRLTKVVPHGFSLQVVEVVVKVHSYNNVYYIPNMRPDGNMGQRTNNYVLAAFVVMGFVWAVLGVVVDGGGRWNRRSKWCNVGSGQRKRIRMDGIYGRYSYCYLWGIITFARQ